MIRYSPAYIGLGGNRGDVLGVFRAVVAELRARLESPIAKCSAVYETAPVGGIEQANFLNAVAVYLTPLPVADVWQNLAQVEKSNGRDRDNETRWGPRILDLDLLVFGRLTLASASLTVPHPRLADRAFALLPLSDVAPNLLIPSCGPLPQLVASTRGQAARRLAETL